MIPGHKISDFDSPDLPGSGKRMQASTLKKLALAEKYYGKTFHYNSAYRTPTHNKKVGGVPGSAHTKGYAVDIRTNPGNQQKIIDALIKAGFKRIGIGKYFVHADNDPDKPTPAVWLYSSTKNTTGYKLRKKVLADIAHTGSKGISLVGVLLVSTLLGMLLRNGS